MENNPYKPGTSKYTQTYNKLNYKQLKVDIKPEDYSFIDEYCKENKISKAKFIVKACKYCIDNEIDFEEK